MNSKLNVTAAPAWLIATASICIVLGVWLRFAHLDTKYYHLDEVYTSLYVAGYSVDDLSHLTPHGTVSASQLETMFQSPGPRRGAIDTIRVLAETDVKHPPLYYLLERGAQGLFGPSVAGRRVLSAIAGTLLLPAAFWLCIELFDSTAVAWLAATLVALSPYQLVYSQQAVESTVFEVLATVAAALLARAFRKQGALLWVSYALALVLMLYSATLSLLLLMAFTAFAIIRARACGRSALNAFGLSTAGALFFFAPWLVTFARHWHDASQQNEYAATALPLKLYVAKIVFAVTSVFFDAEYLNVSLAVVLVPVCMAVAYALWLFYPRALVEGKALLVSIFGTTFVVFLLTDAIGHASRATQQRYLIPAVLALEIAVACGCAATLSLRLRWVAPGLIAVLLGAELSSCVIGEGQRSWWGNNVSAHLAEAGRRAEADPGAELLMPNLFLGLQLSDLVSPTMPELFDVPSSPGIATIYTLNPSYGMLVKLRLIEHQQGQLISFTSEEQHALKAIHAQVASAHGIPQGDILWRFRMRVSTVARPK